MADQAKHDGRRSAAGQGPAYPLPPAQVEPFVAVLGIEGTLTFLLAFGGAELVLSPDPKGHGMVERLIGADKARELAASRAADQRRVPLAKPWVARCLCAQGEARAAVARRLHVSDVSVRRWLPGFNGVGRHG